MPAPIGRLLQGRGKHGVFEILQRRAMMLAPARLALGAVQGTVEVAKPYGAARRCVHLQDSRCSADRAKSNPAFLWTATGARRRGRKRGMQSEPRARRAGLRRCSADRAKSSSALTWTGNSARGRSARHCACGQFLQDSATMPAPARMA